MTEHEQTPSTSWGSRTAAALPRRLALVAAAAVTFGAVAPALANTAGADVPNPVVVALRASGSKVADVVGKSVAQTQQPTEPQGDDVDEGDDATGHGKVVSTVARCAPRGKDPLLAVAGAPAHHGGYVRVAAHGDSLTTPWGTFDLATQAGADALCRALATARAALAADAEKPASKPAKAGKDRKGKGKTRGEMHGRPAGGTRAGT